MNSDKSLRIYRLWIIIFSISLVLFAAGITVVSILPGESVPNRTVFFAVFTVLATVAALGLGLSIKTSRDQRVFLEQLRVENSYTLGRPSTIFNLEAFKTRVESLRKSRRFRKYEQYLVAFTPTALEVSSNPNRNKVVNDLHYHIAEFLEKLFADRKETEFESKYNVFAFNRGIFLIYCFTNDENYVHKLLNRISNECFRMVNEDKIRIWVQPFFGINKISKEASITSDVEDALIARSHSEQNIESFTYFLDTFRESDSTESSEIATALENDEFVPYYQAKYSLTERRFISSEVLARWKSPKYGVLGPSKFIDQAEKSGILNAIDIRIFELAIRDLSENLKRGRRVLPISINFSLYEFFSRNFLDLITSTLEKYKVSPSLLEIEITETTSQVNKFLSLSVIRKLKDMGIRVLMDDFGVGYSQIDNLQQIPFDAIKIDKSFTNKIIDDQKTRSIVKFLIELGHSNNMEVIVEGAETKDQVDILRKFKVDTVQGFYFSRPLSFAAFNELLKENKFEKGVKR